MSLLDNCKLLQRLDYDPDQPRDEAGRFGEGSGSSVSATKSAAGRPSKSTRAETPKSISDAIRRHMASGRLFPSEAVRIEKTGSSDSVWVVDDESRKGIKLFPDRHSAQKAIDKAVRLFDKERYSGSGS